MIPLYDVNRPQTKPIINYGLILTNITVFFYFLLTGNLMNGISQYGAVPADLLRGSRLWTLITSMFMHADIMHLAGNMLYLWIFGDNIEDTVGHSRYLLFYIAGGVFSALMHIISTIFSSFLTPIPYLFYELRVPTVGASGAISAVLGAYLLLFPGARIRTLVFMFYIFTVVNIPAFFYLGFWFLYQLMMGLFSLIGLPSTVAFWAHIGGFVFGMITVKGLNITPKRRPTAPRRKPIVAPWTRTPLVDILVEEEIVRVYAFMPGVEMEDIRIDVSEWELIISAQKEEMKYYGRIALPVPVLPSVKEATYINGTLSFILLRADRRPIWI
jgi:hypothetical protein